MIMDPNSMWNERVRIYAEIPTWCMVLTNFEERNRNRRTRGLINREMKNLSMEMKLEQKINNSDVTFPPGKDVASLI